MDQRRDKKGIRVGIIGASGYTGGELARILLGHPRVEITCVSSRTYAGQSLGQVFPNLFGLSGPRGEELVCEDLAPIEVAERCDVIFTAVPHGVAMEIARSIMGIIDVKLIDLGADFRFRDAGVYEAWYKKKHEAPRLLAEAVYGLPELHRALIEKARIVGNPGCYPTSAILALAPLIKSGMVDPSSIVINSMSGVSGAGRTPSQGYHFPECNENARPYGIPGHRHTPEIEQELSLLSRTEIRVSFSPHLVPITRGILTTAYATLDPASASDSGAGRVSTDSLIQLYKDFYRGERFIRILDDGRLPQTKAVWGSNFCDIGVRFDERVGRVVVMAAIDNLVKGAAGQAVQNMNIMFGIEEDCGLDRPPVFP
ncbi:MAG TPA: N-acetyl-gamma-glutamyl-phosphate reductase [Firmicutes bacterium]|nr:N-acetyl-gamma-glutamyl-phosphate reductase [Bacillota bacterium]